jgi:predicted transcriptional regulator
MATQAPIKVNEQTKDRIRYLAAFTDATQADIVDRAVSEYAVRHADDIAKGIERAREVLSSGDAAIAAHLLVESTEDVEQVSSRTRRRPARSVGSKGPTG